MNLSASHDLKTNIDLYINGKLIESKNIPKKTLVKEIFFESDIEKKDEFVLLFHEEKSVSEEWSIKIILQSET